MGAYGCMGCTDIWVVYGHMGTYGCTCLPTTPEGICKKFFFALDHKPCSSSKYRNRGQKPIKMSECTPINTNPDYPTK